MSEMSEVLPLLKVVCNPRGYVNQVQPENPQFDAGLVVEV